MGGVSLLAATGIIVTQTNCGQSDSSMLPTPAESSGTAAANEGGNDEKPVAIPEEKDSGAETVSSNGQDWPVWSGNGDGNLYSPEKGIAENFEPGKFKKGTEEIDMGTTTNVKWVAKLGSQAYGNTTVSNGKVFVGTNNESPRDERHIGDRGIVYCLDEETGEIIERVEKISVYIHQLAMDQHGDLYCASVYPEHAGEKRGPDGPSHRRWSKKLSH